jgi:hypothetical protein
LFHRYRKQAFSVSKPVKSHEKLALIENNISTSETKQSVNAIKQHTKEIEIPWYSMSMVILLVPKKNAEQTRKVKAYKWDNQVKFKKGNIKMVA